ncbi:MAG: MATE family efflux transporter, partial [Eubacteriaceae bacterium]|nr:MATE family efflux transporter [Eubacteriaceae bacterium]
YGSLSPYGADIPLAVAGVVAKVNTVVLAFNVGTGQGCQPILGFNYGAKNYSRVRETYLKAAAISLVMSTSFFACFQLFPRQIASIFGSGSDLYFQFAERYIRIYMLLMFANGLQPITVNFFNSIGKAAQGIFLSITRQGLYLIPLLLLLPMKYGIEGAVFAGPIADSFAVTTCVLMAMRELRRLKALDSGIA